MRETRIKICGITSPEDARLSSKAGADYLGLIFADSRRSVTVDTARAIREAVPHAILVGVFSDSPIDRVIDVGREAGLNMVQLHGDESADYCDALLSRLSLPIIKAFRADRLPDAETLSHYTKASYFLFDLDKNSRRSSGRTVNGNQERLWKAAARRRAKGYRVFLAGALTPTNVRSAVRHVDPYCIDVASGVEKAPGIKDSDALRRFIQEVKR